MSSWKLLQKPALNVARATLMAHWLRENCDRIAPHFNLGVWRFMGGTQKVLDSDLENASTNMCGTYACAVGWALTIPEFKAQGFMYAGCTPQYIDATLQVYRGCLAVEQFLGLHAPNSRKTVNVELINYYNLDLFNFLFSGWGYPDRDDLSPLDVAERLLELVEKYNQFDSTGEPA